MNVTKTMAASTVAAAFSLLTAHAGNYYWNPYVQTGSMADGNSWYGESQQTGVAPGAGDTGNFRSESLQVAGVYTAVVPQGVFMDAAATYVCNLPAGTKVVFDASAPGAYWAKVRGAAAWADGNILKIGQSDHIFNLEGIDSGDPSDVLGFLFSGGVISYAVQENGEELSFDSGLFDNHVVVDEYGNQNACRHSTILLHSSRPNARVVFKGGETHLHKASIRGNSPGGEVVVDGGDVHFWNDLKVKEWNGDAEGVLRIKDGTATVESGWISLGGSGKPGHVILEDEGRFVLKQEEFNFDEPGSTFRMSGDSKLDALHDVKFRNHVDVELSGGTVDAFEKEIMFTGNAGTTFKLNGADLVANVLVVEGEKNSFGTTNAIEQSAGVVTVRWALDIRGESRNAMYLLSGGELQTRDMVRLGHGGASNGGHAIFRQTGGLATLQNGINICDGENTDGELELLGGITRTKEIRGWLHCETRDAAKGGRASCLFDGGTLVPYENNMKLVNLVSEAKVGARGLTVDTAGYDNIGFEAKLENADGASGLFVKKGAGTLKMAMVEADSAAQGEWANRSLAATHSLTRVEKGTLELLGGGTDAACGASVTVLGGAALSLGEGATRLTATRLDLGDGHGFATLKLKSGDVVVVTGSLSAVCGSIDAPWAATKGTHPVFVCAFEPEVGELAKITVAGASADCDYTWAVSDYEDGLKLCSVVVADAGTLTKTITYASGTVTTNGTGSAVGAIAASENAVQRGELPLAWNSSASVDEGTTLTLDGPLVGAGVEFSKTGSGKLALGGDNADFYGSFASRGGILEVGSATAFGASPLYFPLVLGCGTFSYTGAPATFEGALKIDGENKKTAILDNAGDLTFKEVEYVKGLFVKKGAGTLTLDLPSGNYDIGSGSDAENIGANGGTIGFPANGNAPESSSGLYGVNILEGTVRVVGEGAEGTDATVLSTRNSAILGGGYKGDAPAVLEVENARVNWGAAWRSGHVGCDLPEGTPAPELRLKNAYFWSDSLKIGTSGTCVDGPVVKLVDSTLEGVFECWIGNYSCSPVIFATNSVMTADQRGWKFSGSRVTATFSGPQAALCSTDDGSAGEDERGRVMADYGVTGTVTFYDGARLETTRGILFKNSTLGLVFDGGVFRINTNNSERASTSMVEHSDNPGFVTTGKGMTIDICEGSTHTLDVKISGSGGVVKSGAGALVLPKKVEAAGAFEIAEGSVRFVEGMAPRAIKVGAGATADFDEREVALDWLDAAGGAGIGNGMLDVGELMLTAGGIPNFAYATFSNAKMEVAIDFGEASPNVTKGDRFAVAKFYADVVGTPLPASYLDVSGWRGMAKGYTKKTLGRHGGSYVFAYDEQDGTLYAEYVPRSGFTVIIR